MHSFQPPHRQALSQRAFACILAIMVNVAIAGFIDRLAEAGTQAEEMAVVQPAHLPRG